MEGHVAWPLFAGPFITERYNGYRAKQYNVIIDVLGGYSKTPR